MGLRKKSYLGRITFSLWTKNIQVILYKSKVIRLDLYFRKVILRVLESIDTIKNIGCHISKFQKTQGSNFPDNQYNPRLSDLLLITSKILKHMFWSFYLKKDKELLT